MADAQLTGRVIYPNDPAWDFARKGFCARADFQSNIPKAVVYAQDAHDVQNALAWTRQNQVPFSVRSGGHSFEGYSSFAKDGIIIDVSEIDHVRISQQDCIARVGAGIHMLALSEKLCDSGCTIPLATGPGVGLGGFVQGGGFGFSSRLHGLACDNLLEAQAVTASGEIVTASEQENKDLFWALRGGGGGNFGVLTECTFQTHPVGLVAVFRIEWPWEALTEVVAAWQNWFPKQEDGITTMLSLTLDGRVTIYGQFTASVEQLGSLGPKLLPLIALSPISFSAQMMPYVVAARAFFGADLLNPQWAIRKHGAEQLFKSSSAVARQPFPVEAIQKLKGWLDNAPPLSVPGSQPSMVQLLGGGGAINRVDRDATAVHQRDAHCIVQYDGYWSSPQDRDAVYEWVVAMRKDMLPYADGAYVNYHDADLKSPMDDYYGPHVERLREIKHKVDPENFFNHPQSIW